MPGELSGASTLGELLDVWLRDIVESRNIRPQTVSAYRTKANRLKREFGALEIAELPPRRMQIVMNDLAKCKTASEFQALKTVLKQAFRYAVRAELLSANPLDSLEPVRPAEQGPPVALNVEQVQSFRRAFAEYVEEGVRDSNRRKAQLAVDIILGLGGLRISEALPLRHRDVDFENCTASINGTLVYLPHEPLQRQDKLKRDGQARIVRWCRDVRASGSTRAMRSERARARAAAAAPGRNQGRRRAVDQSGGYQLPLRHRHETCVRRRSSRHHRPQLKAAHATHAPPVGSVTRPRA
ncbi:hypothetical protein CEP17_05165 [Microbacterium sp. PM5]|nr:hypothetical protein CEP17_05165 [Microbacterium sp. PM5]